GPIEVQGNRRVEAATIQSYFGAADRPLDEKAVDAGLKALYASGLFTDAKGQRDGERLIVTLGEAPPIDRIAFDGTNSPPDKDLQGETQSKARGALIAANVQADVMRLTELYQHAGRFDARVVPKTVTHGADRVDPIFEINEGAKTTVKRIAFTGNDAVAAWR